MARNIRGRYFLTSESSPAFSPAGKPFWEVKGTAVDGKRIRERFEQFEAAVARKKELEVHDCQPGNAKHVLVSQVIRSKERLLDVERGYVLFPRNSEDKVDPRYTFTGAVGFALEMGWHPSPPGANRLVSEVMPNYLEYLKARSNLKTSDANHIGEITLHNNKSVSKRIVKEMGALTIKQLADVGATNKLVLQKFKSVTVQRVILSLLNGLFEWCESEKLLTEAPHFVRPPLPKRQLPKIMSSEAIQAWLDHSWATRWATAGVLLLHCALRPSELFADGAGVSENLRIFSVPDERTKTGWRNVDIPPVAQVLLGILKKENRLDVSAPTSSGAAAIFRGKMGYALGRGNSRKWARSQREVKKHSSSLDECVNEFRKLYPMKFGKWIPDLARHTGGSFHVAACGDPGRTADWMGNTLDVVKEHYRGRIDDMDDVVKFYQLVPTALKKIVDQTTIPLPFWFNRHSHEESQIEKRLVAKLSQPGTVVLPASYPALPGEKPVRGLKGNFEQTPEVNGQ